MKAPGWYDLYDTDEAMKIVEDQANDISSYLESIQSNNATCHSDPNQPATNGAARNIPTFG